MTDTWNTQAIVLFHRPFRERDRLYTVYTERFGKQVLRAHGTRKITSKLAGSLEPFAEIDLFMIQARVFPKIGGAVVRHRFTTLREDTAKLNAAMFVADITSQSHRDGVADPKFYTLLYSTLTWIDTHDSVHKAVLFSFAVKASRLLGYDLAAQATQPEVSKVLQWMSHATYSEVQKLRMDQLQWNGVVHGVRSWIFDNTSSHVHTDRFLV